MTLQADSGSHGCLAAVRLAEPIDPARHKELLNELIFRGYKWDVQIGDFCAVSRRAIVIGQEAARELYGMAERLWSELEAIERWVAGNPASIRRLGLPRRLARLLKRQQGRLQVPRMARFDFHPTEQGWRISEVNSDVPGGYVEASMLPMLWPGPPRHCRPPENPAEAYVQSLLPGLDPGPVGLLHAPWYSDDRQHMEYLRSLFAKRGIEAVAAGPGQIRFKAGKIYAGEQEMALLVRFFPCEWLLGHPAPERWFEPNQCAIANPLFSIVTQSKKLPLLWNSLPFRVPEWSRLLPETRAVGWRDLIDGNGVLKPCLGRVGEGICLPGVTTRAHRTRTLRKMPFEHGSWISQKRFNPVNFGSEGRPQHLCLGVYVVNGKAAGIYGRVSSSALTNETAADAPVFIHGESQW